MLYRTKMFSRTQNVVQANLSSNFNGEQTEFITKMCLLYWVCRLIRKYKLPFSFKAATNCSINKYLQKCRTGHK